MKCDSRSWLRHDSGVPRRIVSILSIDTSLPPF